MNNKLKKIIYDFIRLDYSKRVVRQFYRWMVNGEHEAEKEELLHGVWQDTESVRISDRQVDDSFRQVMHRIHSQDIRSGKFSTRLSWWQYAAAVAVIVTTTVWVTRMTMQENSEVVLKEYYAQNGEMKDLVLPDGSVVSLNGGSHIYYPENLTGKTRSVHLIGEAVFKVAKNPEKPFVVHSMNMSVTALGTAFNVKAYPENDYMEATLLEGKVRVACNDSVDYILSPGEQVVYDKQTATSRRLVADVESVTAWQRGELIFNKVTVDEMLQTLEHRFGIEYRMVGARQHQDEYNFVFRSDAEIDEVLKVMQVVVDGFTYRKKNGVYYMSIDK